jgi:hypothetical protein
MEGSALTGLLSDFGTLGGLELALLFCLGCYLVVRSRRAARRRQAASLSAAERAKLLDEQARRRHAEEARRADEQARLQQAEAEARRREAAAAQRQLWEYQVRALALTCPRCSDLALPIPNTPDRYGCPACNHQFVGAHHGTPFPPAGD